MVVSLTAWGSGKQSGMETVRSFWQVWTVRDGKVVRGRGYTSRAEALEAAGLRE